MSSSSSSSSFEYFFDDDAQRAANAAKLTSPKEIRTEGRSWWANGFDANPSVFGPQTVSAATPTFIEKTKTWTALLVNFQQGYGALLRHPPTFFFIDEEFTVANTTYKLPVEFAPWKTARKQSDLSEQFEKIIVPMFDAKHEKIDSIVEILIDSIGGSSGGRQVIVHTAIIDTARRVQAAKIAAHLIANFRPKFDQIDNVGYGLTAFSTEEMPFKIMQYASMLQGRTIVRYAFNQEQFQQAINASIASGALMLFKGDQRYIGTLPTPESIDRRPFTAPRALSVEALQTAVNFVQQLTAGKKQQQQQQGTQELFDLVATRLQPIATDFEAVGWLFGWGSGESSAPQRPTYAETDALLQRLSGVQSSLDYTKLGTVPSPSYAAFDAVARHDNNGRLSALIAASVAYSLLTFTFEAVFIKEVLPVSVFDTVFADNQDKTARQQILTNYINWLTRVISATSWTGAMATDARNHLAFGDLTQGNVDFANRPISKLVHRLLYLAEEGASAFDSPWHVIFSKAAARLGVLVEQLVVDVKQALIGYAAYLHPMSISRHGDDDDANLVSEYANSAAEAIDLYRRLALSILRTDADNIAESSAAAEDLSQWTPRLLMQQQVQLLDELSTMVRYLANTATLNAPRPGFQLLPNANVLGRVVEKRTIVQMLGDLVLRPHGGEMFTVGERTGLLAIDHTRSSGEARDLGPGLLLDGQTAALWDALSTGVFQVTSSAENAALERAMRSFLVGADYQLSAADEAMSLVKFMNTRTAEAIESRLRGRTVQAFDVEDDIFVAAQMQRILAQRLMLFDARLRTALTAKNFSNAERLALLKTYAASVYYLHADDRLDRLFWAGIGSASPFVVSSPVVSDNDIINDLKQTVGRLSLLLDTSMTKGERDEVAEIRMQLQQSVRNHERAFDLIAPDALDKRIRELRTQLEAPGGNSSGNSQLRATLVFLEWSRSVSAIAGGGNARTIENMLVYLPRMRELLLDWKSNWNQLVVALAMAAAMYPDHKTQLNGIIYAIQQSGIASNEENYVALAKRLGFTAEGYLSPVDYAIKSIVDRVEVGHTTLRAIIQSLYSSFTAIMTVIDANARDIPQWEREVVTMVVMMSNNVVDTAPPPALEALIGAIQQRQRVVMQMHAEEMERQSNPLRPQYLLVERDDDEFDESTEHEQALYYLLSRGASSLSDGFQLALASKTNTGQISLAEFTLDKRTNANNYRLVAMPSDARFDSNKRELTPLVDNALIAMLRANTVPLYSADQLVLERAQKLMKSFRLSEPGEFRLFRATNVDVRPLDVRQKSVTEKTFVTWRAERRSANDNDLTITPVTDTLDLAVRARGSSIQAAADAAASNPVSPHDDQRAFAEQQVVRIAAGQLNARKAAPLGLDPRVLVERRLPVAGAMYLREVEHKLSDSEAYQLMTSEGISAPQAAVAAEMYTRSSSSDAEMPYNCMQYAYDVSSGVWHNDGRTAALVVASDRFHEAMRFDPALIADEFTRVFGAIVAKHRIESLRQYVDARNVSALWNSTLGIFGSQSKATQLLNEVHLTERIGGADFDVFVRGLLKRLFSFSEVVDAVMPAAKKALGGRLRSADDIDAALRDIVQAAENWQSASDIPLLETEIATRLADRAQALLAARNNKLGAATFDAISYTSHSAGVLNRINGNSMVVRVIGFDRQVVLSKDLEVQAKRVLYTVVGSFVASVYRMSLRSAGQPGVGSIAESIVNMLGF